MKIIICKIWDYICYICEFIWGIITIAWVICVLIWGWEDDDHYDTYIFGETDAIAKARLEQQYPEYQE